MQMTAVDLYGAQPVAAPTAVPSAEQHATSRPASPSGRSEPRAPRGRDTDGEVGTGQRALLLWVVLVGVAIGLGWFSVSGSVRVGS